MKEKIVLLLLSFFCLSAVADDPRTHLVVLAKDGSKTVFPLSSQPMITFSEADLTVTTNGVEAVYSLEDVKQFTYESSNDYKCTLVLSNPMATFCSPLNLDFSSVNGVKAYVGSSFDQETGILTMTPVNNVAAGTGILLIGEVGSYDVPLSDVAPSYDNLLKGVTIATEIDPQEGDYINYILVNGTHGTGFYRLSSSGLLAAGKAYLQLSKSSSTRQSISISYDGTITSIDNVEVEEFDNPYYRLDGIRMMDPLRKGIYVRNGKIIVVK